MITLVEAKDFRALKYVKQRLHRFHALVGPNAAGKTTFLDIPSFLGQLVSEGPQEAVKARTDNYQDMVWGRQGSEFQLAIEAEIPRELQVKLPERHFDTIRYEVKVGVGTEAKALGILGEKAVLKKADDESTDEDYGELFPREHLHSREVYSPRRSPGKDKKLVLHKNPNGNDNFYSEVHENRGAGWLPAFRFGTNKSALGNLPDDGTRFPVCTWLRDFLVHDVQRLVLNSLEIRKASALVRAWDFVSMVQTCPGSSPDFTKRILSVSRIGFRISRPLCRMLWT